MTIAILIMVLVNTAAIIYLTAVIFKIRDGEHNYHSELVKIMNEQRDVLQGTLDSTNKWCNIGEDIIDHIKPVEDMEGDIKDIFEWIHSVDNNIADMRRNIQEANEKLNKIDKITGRYKDTNTNLLKDLIDLNKIYGNSNVQFTTYDFEPDKQKREDNDSNRTE